MSVAIETVIIVIVVVSFTVLAAIVFALYWLWRLLLEDRRCSRLDNGSFTWRRGTTGLPIAVMLTTSMDAQNEEEHRVPLTSDRCTSFPRITRASDVIVDERGLRMTRNKRECSSRSQPSHQSNDVRSPTEVVVLDGTEPPPPYDSSE